MTLREILPQLGKIGRAYQERLERFLDRCQQDDKRVASAVEDGGIVAAGQLKIVAAPRRRHRAARRQTARARRIRRARVARRAIRRAHGGAGRRGGCLCRRTERRRPQDHQHHVGAARRRRSSLSGQPRIQRAGLLPHVRRRIRAERARLPVRRNANSPARSSTRSASGNAHAPRPTWPIARNSCSVLHKRSPK